MSVDINVNQFNVKGFAGLQEEFKPGRPPSLNETMISSINSDLRTNPGTFGYSQNFWDGKLLSYHIEKVYKIKLGVRQCQRLFNKPGFGKQVDKEV